MRNTFKTLVLGAAGALLLSACFTNDGVSSRNRDASIKIGMALDDAAGKKSGLSKGSVISLTKLVVLMTSNATTPDTVRDTILPGNNGFKASVADTQIVAKSYSIKPLRNWTITIKTLDQNDSVIHISTKSADSIKVGETRNVTIDLTSKFTMYVTRLILPDSLKATGTFQKQVLNTNRVVMVIDGDTVVDSSRVGYFAPRPTVHQVRYDYVKADTVHDVALFIFADIPGWPADKPVYADTITVNPGVDSLTPPLPWTGPGSPSDPNYNPLNPGGATTNLVINIGKVGTTFIAPTFTDNPFDKRSGK